MQRKNLIFLARLCGQAERYDDMVPLLKEVIKTGGELSVDEWNLLTIAFNNVFGTRNLAVTSAYKAYKIAANAARTEFTATHPLRLGLALNFSVFYYKILNSRDRARHLAKHAFDDSKAEVKNESVANSPQHDLSPAQSRPSRVSSKTVPNPKMMVQYHVMPWLSTTAACARCP
ncbi:14-3-3 domain-containing protein [Ilyonectria sp. MPI-CAGE-AT-0026]|nr:14-3-3 domain-containing protein [Ilyonectria sp. MPI-CAGE-AT-0026]